MDPLAQERLLEQIDACRHHVDEHRVNPRAVDEHGPDDLRDPALSDLAQAVAAGDERACRMLAQVEAADAAISAALHDVQVPDDLAERLLVALKAAEHGEPIDAAALRRLDRPANVASLATATAVASTTQASDVLSKIDLNVVNSQNVNINVATQGDATLGTPVAPAAQARATEVAEPAWRARPGTRRTWLRWTLGAGTAVAAAVALFCLLYPWPPPWVEPDEIAQHINVLYDSEIAYSDDWSERVSLPAVLGELSLSSDREREFTFGRHSATAYNLVSRDPNRQATLVVINRRVRGLDYALPRAPQLSTHGRSIGIWQSETQVFALIVEGTEHDYKQLVEQQAFA